MEGMMNFCIPYLTIEPIISKLSAQFWYSSARQMASTENLAILKDKLITADINLTAEVGRIPVTMRDVLALQPGDMIQLYNIKVGQPFSLNVGNISKFLCKPGVVGKKMAVQIVKKIADFEQMELEELMSEPEDML
jgi:flagellar motor switch protein FliM